MRLITKKHGQRVSLYFAEYFYSNNIEIGTNSENQLDVPREIRVAAAEKATPIKYNNVKDIREYYAQCGSYKDTMEKFGITSKGTLYYILKERKLLSK